MKKILCAYCLLWIFSSCDINENKHTLQQEIAKVEVIRDTLDPKFKNFLSFLGAKKIETTPNLILTEGGVASYQWGRLHQIYESDGASQYIKSSWCLDCPRKDIIDSMVYAYDHKAYKHSLVNKELPKNFWKNLENLLETKDFMSIPKKENCDIIYTSGTYYEIIYTDKDANVFIKTRKRIKDSTSCVEPIIREIYNKIRGIENNDE